jgi:ketosteroid isomerase-like protein
MSEENVEFVRGFFVAGETMNKQQLLDSLPELIPQTCDPEIEWHEHPDRADAQVYRGHDGVLRSFQQWLEGFDEYGVTVDDVVDCGDDVFVAAHERGRGAASGATADAAIFVVITMRDGKILRYREFYDERRAREAAGLTASS